MARLSSILIPIACVATALLGVGIAINANGSPAASTAKESLHRSIAVGHPTFVSPHAAPIAKHSNRVFVVNTPSDTLDVIDEDTRKVLTRINVGIDPVSIAVRPDGKEIWVSNHISDSVSVIDNDSSSATYLQVVATIQEFDLETKATRFDEPVGIAFANNEKAYVALSSENRIAVIDVGKRKVIKRLTINAQDPRAIVVRGNRLYVIPFESNNKTQLSGGYDMDSELVTFNAHEHSIANNNVLSLGAVLDIIKHPRVPDRDLYVFDTRTDKLVEVVDTLGTLLYGLTVDSQGRVFVAQTDARNDANGLAGTKDHGLKELENRAFLNRISTVEFESAKNTESAKAGKEPKVDFIDLEPLPPNQPEPGEALATPFAIEISSDDTTLVVSAAGSDKLFTVDAVSGKVLGRADVGAVPRGIALDNNDDGKPSHAWVLNAVENSVSLVDVSDTANPTLVDTVALADPTQATVKRGRIAFNTASASTTGTFSCASCHPDGHTDQLLWVLKTPIVTGGDQIMPRSTMPIRGLRDTAPYHWDGIPGDPYGGNNSANVHGFDEPNSSVDDPASTTRHLIDGGLASTMSMVGDQTKNDEGKLGLLSAAERDAMATFLLSVPFPPAQRRAYDNVVSRRAEEGFKLFHIDGDHQDGPTPNVCGNCHRMPFLVSTNTPGSGMDAPTWRGAYDRFLILPQGRLNIIDFDFYRDVAERGIPERNVWQFSWAGRRRFDPVWDMVLEGSTGFSGSFSRQLTLNESSAEEKLTDDLLGALEISAAEGAIVLEGEGVLVEESETTPVAFQFDGHEYISKSNGEAFTRSDLIALASAGKFVFTLTARHGDKASVDHPQPAIWTLGPIEQQRGRQEFPILFGDNKTMTVSGRHISDSANVIIDGRRVSSIVRVDEADEIVEVTLSHLPNTGMHLLQLQNPNGMFSNDFIFHVTNNEDAARELKREIDLAHVNPRDALGLAVIRGDMPEVKRHLSDGTSVDDRRPDGSTLLSTAGLYGQHDIVKLLIQEGADVEATNRDGNTPLIVASWACETEIVKLLLDNGASPLTENNREESAIDVVSSSWEDETASFYTGVGRALRIEFDLEYLRTQRPKIAQLLRDHVGSEKVVSEETTDNGE